MTTNKEYCEGLVKDIKIVAYSRFNKVRRLKRNNYLGLFAISAISISVIVLSIIEKVYSIKTISLIPFTALNIDIWIFSVLSSIIILSISIALSTIKTDIEIEKLNKSAVKLNEIRRSIEFKIQHGQDDYESLFNEYNQCINSDLINHDEVDQKINKYLVNKKEDTIEKIKYYFRFYITQNINSIFFGILILLALFSFISAVSQVIIKC